MKFRDTCWTYICSSVHCVSGPLVTGPLRWRCKTKNLIWTWDSTDWNEKVWTSLQGCAAAGAKRTHSFSCHIEKEEKVFYFRPSSFVLFYCDYWLFSFQTFLKKSTQNIPELVHACKRSFGRNTATVPSCPWSFYSIRIYYFTQTKKRKTNIKQTDSCEQHPSWLLGFH